MAAALRSRPRLAIIDARGHPVAALKGCERLKADSFTGIIPVIVWARDDATSFAAAFDAGAFAIAACSALLYRFFLARYATRSGGLPAPERSR